MSILKLKIQDFREVSTPRAGWKFLGYDTSGGTLQYGALAEMNEFGDIYYIESGVTTGMSGTAGTSGISGGGGSSGTSSTSGTSGIKGNTGSPGTGGSSGTSGANGVFLGTNGSSGTGGTSGLSYGSSGTSGSGSSGTSGYGSSGTSGSGSSGTSGLGISGSSGTSGFGSSGTSGFGSSGTSGFGSSGTSGSKGSSGTSGRGSSSGTSGNDGISDINSFTWVISYPEVGGIPGPKIWGNAPGFYGYDGLRIDSYISGGTNLTFNIQDRYTDYLLVSGDTVYSGLTTDLTLTDDEFSFWRRSTIAPDYIPTLTNDSWLWLDITDVNGSPDKFLVTVFVTPYWYL